MKRTPAEFEVGDPGSSVQLARVSPGRRGLRHRPASDLTLQVGRFWASPAVVVGDLGRPAQVSYVKPCRPTGWPERSASGNSPTRAVSRVCGPARSHHSVCRSPGPCEGLSRRSLRCLSSLCRLLLRRSSCVFQSMLLMSFTSAIVLPS
jgi:hypothetical protein